MLVVSAAASFYLHSTKVHDLSKQQCTVLLAQLLNNICCWTYNNLVGKVEHMCKRKMAADTHMLMWSVPGLI